MLLDNNFHHFQNDHHLKQRKFLEDDLLEILNLCLVISKLLDPTREVYEDPQSNHPYQCSSLTVLRQLRRECYKKLWAHVDWKVKILQIMTICKEGCNPTIGQCRCILVTINQPPPNRCLDSIQNHLPNIPQLRTSELGSSPTFRVLSRI